MVGTAKKNENSAAAEGPPMPTTAFDLIPDTPSLND